jgi:hypothetical protein
MRTLALALALALPAAPLPAQTPTAGLRAMLAQVPAELVQPLTNPRGTLGYGDLAAARALPLPEGADPARAGWRGIAPESGDLPLQAAQGWPGLVGFGPAQVDRMLALPLDGPRAVLWQLAPEAGAEVPAALGANGYHAETRGGLGAWVRGAEDHGLNLRARNPDDPFGGRLGQSQRVRVLGDLVVQTSGWDVLARLDRAAAAPGDRAQPLGAVLDALDAVPGGGVVVNALVLPFAGDGRLHRPAAIPFATPPVGEGPAPQWLSGVLADVAQEGGQVAVLALAVALPDAAAAADLRDRLAARWDGALSGVSRTYMRQLLGAPAELAVLPSADKGLWVVRLVLAGDLDEAGGVPRNTAWHRLLGMAMQADLVFLPP